MASVLTTGQPKRRIFTRRVVTRMSIGLAGLLIVIFATLPPARRMLASVASTTPQIGVTTVLVRGDALQNHVFAPAVIRIPIGSTVTWNFDDRGVNGISELVPHNVVGDGFASAVLSSGTYAHTFVTPGTYDYVCTLHAFMNGRVEVVTQ